MPQDMGDAGLGLWDVLLLAWTLGGDFPWGSLAPEGHGRAPPRVGLLLGLREFFRELRSECVFGCLPAEKNEVGGGSDGASEFPWETVGLPLL